MVAMFARQPVLNRLLVQETSHIFDLSAGAMAHELPITLGNLYGFENHMPVSHSGMPWASLKRIPRICIAGGFLVSPASWGPFPLVRRFGFRLYFLMLDGERSIVSGHLSEMLSGNWVARPFGTFFKHASAFHKVLGDGHWHLLAGESNRIQ
jgi:hypothetical protein